MVDRLRALIGLNVIAGDSVSSFAGSGLTDEEIARELGAASILTLTPQLGCIATLSDATSGEFIAGRGLSFGDDTLDWEFFYENLAMQVSDALLVDAAMRKAEAQAALLNPALSDSERVSGFARARGSDASIDQGVFTEPAVVDALRRIVAEARDDDAAIICCQYSLSEAARRALVSDDELRKLSLEQLMNTGLTDLERLEPLLNFPEDADARAR